MRLTEDKYQQLLKRSMAKPKPVGNSKYRNTKTTRITIIGNEQYDSKLEARYAQQLDLEWHAGEVLWYIRQVPFYLAKNDGERAVVYRADFLVVRPEGIEIIDTTGLMTPAKRNKLKLVKRIYGIDVKVITKVLG